MRVILPVDADKSMVSVTFGRAPYFLIYDTETDIQEVRNNPAASAPGGAGIRAAQCVVDAKVDALITARCGVNSAEVLKMADIKIYKSSSITVKQNIQDLKDGKLTLMDQFSSGFRGGRI